MLHFPTADTLAFWRRTLPAGRAEEHPAGSVLVHEGDPLRSVLLVEHGLVELTVGEPGGAERSVAWRGPGHWLGHSGAILGIPAPATFAAATACRLHRIPVKDFLSALRPLQPSPLWKLCEERNLDLIDLMRSLALTASQSARKRLEFVLSRLVLQQHGPNVRHSVSLDEYSPTNEELSGYVGVTPTYVSRLLAELEAGRIGRRLPDGRIVISRPLKLLHAPRSERNPTTSIAQWKELFRLTAPRQFARRQLLFRQGDPIYGVYLVENGVVDFFINHPITARPQPVLWIGSGHLTGDCFAFKSAPAPLTARTATTCSLHRLSAEQFLDALDLERQPVLGRFVAALNQDVVALATRLVFENLLPLPKQLEHLIWQLDQQYSRVLGSPRDPGRFSPTSAMLARYLATREDYIRRLMLGLRGRGAISRDRLTPTVVTNPNRLFHLPDSDAQNN